MTGHAHIPAHHERREIICGSQESPAAFPSHDSRRQGRYISKSAMLQLWTSWILIIPCPMRRLLYFFFKFVSCQEQLSLFLLSFKLSLQKIYPFLLCPIIMLHFDWSPVSVRHVHWGINAQKIFFHDTLAIFLDMNLCGKPPHDNQNPLATFERLSESSCFHH